MKSNRKVLFSIVLVLIIALVVGCGKSSGGSPNAEIIGEFLNNKAKLYEEKEDILINIKDAAGVRADGEKAEASVKEKGEKNVNELLKDVKKLLTENEYERLMANRELVDRDLIVATYDRAEIKNIEYEIVKEEKGIVMYKVKYTENLYLENVLKKEKKHDDEFTLKMVDDKSLISYIRKIK